jgi:hypothetical protein
MQEILNAAKRRSINSSSNGDNARSSSSSSNSDDDDVDYSAAVKRARHDLAALTLQDMGLESKGEGWVEGQEEEEECEAWICVD